MLRNKTTEITRNDCENYAKVLSIELLAIYLENLAVTILLVVVIK